MKSGQKQYDCVSGCTQLEAQARHVSKSSGLKAMASDKKTKCCSAIKKKGKKYIYIKCSKNPATPHCECLKVLMYECVCAGSLASNVGLDLKRLPGAKVLYNASEDPC